MQYSHQQPLRGVVQVRCVLGLAICLACSMRLQMPMLLAASDGTHLRCTLSQAG